MLGEFNFNVLKKSNLENDLETFLGRKRFRDILRKKKESQ